jgi:hypothetical protein
VLSDFVLSDFVLSDFVLSDFVLSDFVLSDFAGPSPLPATGAGEAGFVARGERLHHRCRLRFFP